jgi:hypothetical protein
LVGTAGRLRHLSQAEPRIFSDLPEPRGREFSGIVVQLRKSG